MSNNPEADLRPASRLGISSNTKALAAAFNTLDAINKDSYETSRSYQQDGYRSSYKSKHTPITPSPLNPMATSISRSVSRASSSPSPPLPSPISSWAPYKPPAQTSETYPKANYELFKVPEWFTQIQEELARQGPIEPLLAEAQQRLRLGMIVTALVDAEAALSRGDADEAERKTMQGLAIAGELGHTGYVERCDVLMEFVEGVRSGDLPWKASRGGEGVDEEAEDEDEDQDQDEDETEKVGGNPLEHWPVATATSPIKGSGDVLGDFLEDAEFDEYDEFGEYDPRGERPGTTLGTYDDEDDENDEGRFQPYTSFTRSTAPSPLRSHSQSPIDPEPQTEDTSRRKRAAKHSPPPFSPRSPLSPNRSSPNRSPTQSRSYSPRTRSQSGYYSYEPEAEWESIFDTDDTPWNEEHEPPFTALGNRKRKQPPTAPSRTITRIRMSERIRGSDSGSSGFSPAWKRRQISLRKNDPRANAPHKSPKVWLNPDSSCRVELEHSASGTLPLHEKDEDWGMHWLTAPRSILKQGVFEFRFDIPIEQMASRVRSTRIFKAQEWEYIPSESEWEAFQAEVAGGKLTMGFLKFENESIETIVQERREEWEAFKERWAYMRVWNAILFGIALLSAFLSWVAGLLGLV
ncbi:hypothetical protein BJX99DRAFT_259111 [Aspergillus californicus]